MSNELLQYYLAAIQDLLEGKGHTATDNHGVDFIEKVFDQLDLIRNFGTITSDRPLNKILPSQNGQERLFGGIQCLGEELQLLLHQEAGDLVREIDTNHGAVGAMSGSKGIVDVDVSELGEGSTEFGGLGGIGLDLWHQALKEM